MRGTLFATMDQLVCCWPLETVRLLTMPLGNYLGEFASEVGENLGKAPVGQRFPDGNFGVPFPSYGHM